MDSKTGRLGITPSIKFEIVSFKPCDDTAPRSAHPVIGGDFLMSHCQTVWQLIYYAYDVPTHPFLLTGQPGWLDTDRYEFEAKVSPEDADTYQKLDPQSNRMMLRGMLADALKLKLHVDLTPHSVYDLVVGKGELKLTPYTQSQATTLPDGHKLEGRGQAATDPDGTAYYQGENMSQFAEAISTRIGKQVINKTNLTGQFNFKTFMPAHYNPNVDDTDDSPIPHIFAGVKALGLDLIPAKELTGGLILDHIERPPRD